MLAFVIIQQEGGHLSYVNYQKHHLSFFARWIILIYSKNISKVDTVSAICVWLKYPLKFKKVTDGTAPNQFVVGNYPWINHRCSYIVMLMITFF